MNIYKLSLFLGVFALCSCQQPDQTLVYLVRHAEKDLSDSTDNPPLTAEGLERASRLRELLGDQELDEIWSTPFQRNVHTVQALAAEQGVNIATYEWHNWEPLADSVKSHAGNRRILICGHGDNLLPMLEYLGGVLPFEAYGDQEYDKIIELTLSGKNVWQKVLVY